MFDKKRCIDNIYAIAKEKNIKIGDLEEKAGVSKGYLSRINKEDSSSVPGIDLVASIASQLGVGIDFLVNYNPGRMTENEKFVQRFIDRLIWGTMSGKVEWDYESRTLLCSETADEVKNPLVHVTKTYSVEADVWYDTHCYRSGIYSDSGVEVIDTCYHAAIPSDTIYIYNDIYLNAVRYHLPNNKLDDKADFVIEVYLRTKDTGVSPICSTFYVKDEIKQSVMSLYETVSSSPSHIGLETKTRHAMKTFMDLMNMEEKM